MFWFSLFLTLGFDVLGMSFAKKYALSSEKIFFALALFCFLCVGFFMTQMLKFQELSLANALWAGISILGTLLIGFFYFREQVNFWQLFGIFSILIGILAIEYGKQ